MCLKKVLTDGLLWQVYLSGSVSSQFLTALLMAAPLSTSKEGIEIIIKVQWHTAHDIVSLCHVQHCIDVPLQDELVSQPYVDMTVKLMERFGVKVELLNGLNHIRVGGCP